MHLAQDRSLDLWAGSPVRYHCTTYGYLHEDDDDDDIDDEDDDDGDETTTINNNNNNTNNNNNKYVKITKYTLYI